MTYKQENNLCTIIFSKNRPLQLSLLLDSFYNQCLQPNSTDVYVIYNYDDEYEKSYKTLKKEQKNLGRIVNFVNEKRVKKSFKSTVLSAIKQHEFILFLVDDNIFTGSFDLDQIISLLLSNSDFIGFSLRLGMNTNYCYPLNKMQKIPNSRSFTYNLPLSFDREKEERKRLKIFAFNWWTSEHDFNYPLEISSSIYGKNHIEYLLKNAEYNNPNSLEGLLSHCSSLFSFSTPMLFSYKTSVAFCAPMNKVQDTAPNNRFSGINIYSPRNMLKMYENGFRVDWKKFNGFIKFLSYFNWSQYTKL
jgi:hypothetical protein